jgi:hypothetical protein
MSSLHNPVHTSYPRIITDKNSVIFSNSELYDISKQYRMELYQQYPSKIFTLTQIDGNQITISVPITPNSELTYQLLKLEICRQTGHDIVSIQLYSDNNLIDKTTNFASLVNQLTLLVVGPLQVTTLNTGCQTDCVAIFYTKIRPFHEDRLGGRYNQHLVTRYLTRRSNQSIGTLRAIGVEDGYLKVNLRQLDDWLREPYHRDYYVQPDINAWLCLTDRMKIESD